MSEQSDTLLVWEVDGQRVEIDLLDIDGVQWRDAFVATGGMTQTVIQYGALALKEVAAIAALVWLAQRRDEPDLKYEEVAGRLTLRSLEGEEVPA